MGSSAESQDIFYVSKRILEALKEKLAKKEEITKEEVTDLTSPGKVDDAEMTAAEWRAVLDEQDEGDLDELGLMGEAGEEEEGGGDEAEDGDGEPAAKKAKTD